MKRALLTMMLLSLATLARADQQTQAVQQALKDQGFYYGEVDGQGGPETDAAIKRYQIRQGLDVTGKLDAETLASLNQGSKNDNSPAPSNDTADAQPPQPAAPQPAEPPKTVTQSDHDFLKNQAPPAPAPASDDDMGAQQQPPPPQAPAAMVPPDAGQAMPEYARFFRKTPYETAPPVVQRSTVQRAQERLARQGFYRGAADGEPSDSLSRALAAYQRYAELSVTGRLDMDTLSDMNLLPKRRVVMGPPGPYEGGAPVYRGIWVH